MEKLRLEFILSFGERKFFACKNKIVSTARCPHNMREPPYIIIISRGTNAKKILEKMSWKAEISLETCGVS